MVMRRISALMAGICLLTALAHSGQSRSGALGPTSRFLMDDTDLWAWPQLAWFYTRGVFVELGDEPPAVSRKSSVLGTYSSAERTLGVFGLAVNRVSPALGEFSAYLNPRIQVNDSTSVAANIVELLQDRGLGAGLPPVPEPQAGFDLFYARKLGGFNAGVRLEHASAGTGDEYTGSSYRAGSSSAGAALGCGYEFTEKLRADAGIGFDFLSFSSEHKLDPGGYSETLDSDGGSHLSFLARAFYSLNDELALVPVLGLERASLGYRYARSEGGLAAGGKTTSSGLSLGAGLQFRPSQRLLLAAGLEAERRSQGIADSLIHGSPGETGSTAIATALPRLSIGFEAQLNRWLQLRGGASKARSLRAVTRDYTDGTSQKLEQQDQPYEFAAGFGIRAGGLSLDLTFNPEMLYTGGKVLSGAGTQPFTRASAAYRF